MIEDLEFISKYKEIDKTEYYIYKIIDTDFKAIVIAPTIADAVIKCYSKRKLNVAKNLTALHLLHKKIYKITIEVSIHICKTYSHYNYTYYLNDIEKYLSLL